MHDYTNYAANQKRKCTRIYSATAHTPFRNYSSHNSFLSYHVRDKSQSKLIFFSSRISSAPETFKYYATNIWYCQIFPVILSRATLNPSISLPRTSRVNSIFADQKLILDSRVKVFHLSSAHEIDFSTVERKQKMLD